MSDKVEPWLARHWSPEAPVFAVLFVAGVWEALYALLHGPVTADWLRYIVIGGAPGALMHLVLRAEVSILGLDFVARAWHLSWDRLSERQRLTAARLKALNGLLVLGWVPVVFVILFRALPGGSPGEEAAKVSALLLSAATMHVVAILVWRRATELSGRPEA